MLLIKGNDYETPLGYLRYDNKCRLESTDPGLGSRSFFIDGSRRRKSAPPRL